MLFDRWSSGLPVGMAPPQRIVQVVEASNVFRYLYQDTEREMWAWSDFPNCAPPWPVFWIEGRVPPIIRSDELGTRTRKQAQLGTRIGANVLAFENKPGWEDLVNALYFKQGQNIVGGDISAWSDKIRDEPVRWIVMMGIQLETSKHEPLIGPLCRVHAVHKDGALSQWRCVAASPGLAGTQADELLKQTDPLTFPIFLALSFINCRNTSLVDAEPPAKLNRRRMKRGKPPLVKYKVLEIEPMRQVLRKAGQQHGVEQLRALHICRGHFAHYTNEAKLFGRHAGTFWRPSHVRGTAEAGEIVKDYEIGPLNE